MAGGGEGAWSLGMYILESVVGDEPARWASCDNISEGRCASPGVGAVQRRVRCRG